ncbi:MAG TPA: 3'-5' exonuclease [Streptosporangiaceae bacterium]
MAKHLTSDPSFTEASYLVIDFEATTPAGHRPEPIEVAVLALRPNGARMAEAFRYEALIQPPEHAPISDFDARQTGITAQMVAGQPPAATVLAELDARLTTPPYRLVAHHAPTEGGIIYDYRRCCPRLAATPLLDTVRLARAVYPELPSHRLDALLDYLNIPRPVGRHRAMADVEATAEVFTRLLEAGSAVGVWRGLRDLTATAGLEAKATKPTQDAMF